MTPFEMLVIAAVAPFVAARYGEIANEVFTETGRIMAVSVAYFWAAAGLVLPLVALAKLVMP